MNNGDLISREALLKTINNEDWKTDARSQLAKFVCRSFVEEAPVADAVEVVRCRHCKHHHWEQEPCHGKTIHFCFVLKAEVFADFYCYHGERREENV